MAQFLSNLISSNNSLLLDTINFTATEGQQAFVVDYTSPYVETYLNGVRLVKDTDFLASNNSSIWLTSGAAGGDALSVVKFKAGNIRNDQTITAGTNLNGGGSLSGNPTVNLDDSITVHTVTANNGVFTGPVTAPTVTANNGVFTGPVTAPTVTANTLAGTLSTAAQPNITSVGTLTSLAVDGLVTAPTVTANTFIGDGSQLTGAGISTGKAIAMAIVFG